MNQTIIDTTGSASLLFFIIVCGIAFSGRGDSLNAWIEKQGVLVHLLVSLMSGWWVIAVLISIFVY